MGPPKNLTSVLHGPYSSTYWGQGCQQDEPTGETIIQVPRDRSGEFERRIIAKYAGNTNELEEKILACTREG